MTDVPLGRLERVELRNIWRTEAQDFTPWLASEENLQILSDSLGMALELEAQERSVGPFRADILCKDLGSDDWVLIENQLERTDHTHLGQLMTYAAGLHAVTVVWIAARFNEEHRAALDWLNEITDERFSFFGLEVELWRIGDSPAAPKFNIVAKPNDWSRSVSGAAKRIDDNELTPIRKLQRDYWTAFLENCRDLEDRFSLNRKPPIESWFAFPIGRSGFNVAGVMLRRENRVRAELYIRGEGAKHCLRELELAKVEIESELGHVLSWESLPERRDCRISAYLDEVDWDDTSDWPRQHRWLCNELNAMHRVFAERIRGLRPLGGNQEWGTGE